jgi:hypothetical protein
MLVNIAGPSRTCPADADNGRFRTFLPAARGYVSIATDNFVSASARTSLVRWYSDARG